MSRIAYSILTIINTTVQYSPGVGGDTMMSSSLGLMVSLLKSSARATFLLANAPAAADVNKGETVIPPCSGAIRGEETSGDSPRLSLLLREVLIDL